MNVKYRSVLAVGMSVAMMVQAPVVAFATDNPQPAESGPVTVAATNPTNETSDNPTDITITDNNGSFGEDAIDPPNTPYEGFVYTDPSGGNYGGADVWIKRDVKTESSQVALTAAGDATTTSDATQINNNLNVYVKDQTISSKTVNGDVITYGTAIETSGQANVFTTSRTIVEGNIVNGGSGNVGISGSVAGGVQTTSSGSIGVTGNVNGNVTNSSGNGNIYILGGVSEQSNISSPNAASGVIQNDGRTVINTNATVIDGTIKESQISGGDATLKGLFVYSIIDNVNGSGINNSANYIIRNSGLNGNLWKAEKVDGEYHSGSYLDFVENTMTGVGAYLPTGWNYANEGQVIMFAVPNGYGYSTSVAATSIGNGRYIITVPEGGGVDIRAWRIAIEEAISKETGAPAVIVQESTPDEVPAEISNTEGIHIISTSAGEALPTTALGNAVAATKSVSLDLSKVSNAQFREAVKSTVQSVPAGGVAVIETNTVATLDKNMIEAMAARPDVAYNIVFKHDGVKMRIVIPAGYDVKSLLDEKGYCGFLRLATLLGFTVLE